MCQLFLCFLKTTDRGGGLEAKHALVAECLSFEGKTKSVVLFSTCDVIFCVAGYSRDSKSQEMKR